MAVPGWSAPGACTQAPPPPIGLNATAIDSLPKSIATLDRQRAALVKTLQALASLGNTATRVITASQKDLVANLQSLYPVLTKLAEAGENLPKSLELLLTYPFPDAAAKAVKGDFTNLDITLDVNTQKALKGILGLNLPTVGLTLPTLMATGAASLPPHAFATGSAVVNMLRQVGLAVGVAALIAVLGIPHSPLETLVAYQRATWMISAIAFLGGIVGLGLLAKRRQTAPVPAAGEPAAPAVAIAAATEGHGV